MTLTRSRATPALRAERTTFRPSAVSPLGSTGRVSDTFTPVAFCTWASALERRSTEAGSATAAPSMSMSMYRSPYALTTAWYSAANAPTELHAWARSMPLAPPKEIFTSPPAARIFLISGSCHPDRGSNALNHDALHPTLVTNPRVYDFVPDALDSWLSSGVGNAPMST